MTTPPILKTGLRWLPALCFAITIFIFSSKPGDEIEQSYDRLAVTLQTISATATVEPAAPTAQSILPTSIPAAQTPAPTPAAEIPFPVLPAYLSFLKLDWLKTGHIIGYFFLGFSVLYALSARSNWSPLIALLLCSLYGVSDEFHQRFVPGRMSLATDVLIDALSALIGVAVLLGIMKLQAFINSKQAPAD
jgi:VanZ family protein